MIKLINKRMAWMPTVPSFVILSFGITDFDIKAPWIDSIISSLSSYAANDNRTS